jgi:hypothetical protein
VQSDVAQESKGKATKRITRQEGGKGRQGIQEIMNDTIKE